MSFINKSVNYSQTNLLKAKLKVDLIKYNEYYKNNIKCCGNDNNGILPDKYHVLLNNNIKYYMYTIKRKELEKCKDESNILYFFRMGEKGNANEKVDEFYMEIDNKFNDNYLFEGYMYTDDNLSKKSFLISDILVKNNNVIREDYTNRYLVLNDIIKYEYKNLNNLLNINIHTVFQKDTVNNIDSLLNIFKNNFIYNKELIAIEEIYNSNKVVKFTTNPNKLQCKKRIIKRDIIDVYDVINIDTGDNEGVLYIRGLKESKYFKEIFYVKNLETVEIECEFNKKFYKWSPVIS